MKAAAQLQKEDSQPTYNTTPQGWLTEPQDVEFDRYLRDLMDTDDTVVTMDLSRVNYLSNAHYERIAAVATQAVLRHMFIRILAPETTAERLRAIRLDALGSVILQPV